MKPRAIYRDLTDARRRWLEKVKARPQSQRMAGHVCRDCEILGWTERLPSGHDVLTDLGREVLRRGRADVPAWAAP